MTWDWSLLFLNYWQALSQRSLWSVIGLRSSLETYFSGERADSVESSPVVRLLLGRNGTQCFRRTFSKLKRPGTPNSIGYSYCYFELLSEYSFQPSKHLRLKSHVLQISVIPSVFLGLLHLSQRRVGNFSLQSGFLIHRRVVGRIQGDGETLEVKELRSTYPRELPAYGCLILLLVLEKGKLKKTTTRNHISSVKVRFCTVHLPWCCSLSDCFLFSSFLERDLFGAEPFDPFSCGAGDFPPDIQSKLDEMQVIKYLPLRGNCFHCCVNAEPTRVSPDRAAGSVIRACEMFDVASAGEGGKFG